MSIRRAATLHSDKLFSVILVVVGVGQGIARYGLVTHRERAAPISDVESVWLPLAQNVLDGVPLYVRSVGAWDNKPPLFEFVNIAVASTGDYYLTFYLLLGFANAVSSILLWRWMVDRGYPRLGPVAAILYLGSIPAVFGLWINPRQIAQIGLLVAVWSPRAVVAGVGLAFAGLFSQYSMLALPAIAVGSIHHMDTRGRIRWLTVFAASGIALAIASYGLVGLVWGPTSFYNAIQYTILSTGEYTSRHLHIFKRPVYWAGSNFVHGMQIAHIWLPALYAMIVFFADKRYSDGRLLSGWDLPTECIALAGLLSLPLIIRPGGGMLIPPLPYLTILAVLGARKILHDVDMKSTGK